MTASMWLCHHNSTNVCSIGIAKDRPRGLVKGGAVVHGVEPRERQELCDRGCALGAHRRELRRPRLPPVQI